MTPIHIKDPLHPTAAELEQIDLHTLLPQREPFVMVGSMTRYADNLTATRTTIAADNMLVEDGRWTAAALLENIAQTCAARIGYTNVYVLHRGVQVGYIAAVRSMEIHALPSVGQTIDTLITIEQEAFGMSKATAVVTCGAKELVRGEINIALSENN